MDITKLKTQLKKKEAEVRTLRNKILDVEERVELPMLREKYQGRYFKYLNSYGRDQASWYLYSHCVEVLNSHFAIVNKFETCSDNKSEFQVGAEHLFTIFETEITAGEYYAALNEFKNRLSVL